MPYFPWFTNENLQVLTAIFGEKS